MPPELAKRLLPAPAPFVDPEGARVDPRMHWLEPWQGLEGNKQLGEDGHGRMGTLFPVWVGVRLAGEEVQSSIIRCTSIFQQMASPAYFLQMSSSCSQTCSYLKWISFYLPGPSNPKTSKNYGIGLMVVFVVFDCVCCSFLSDVCGCLLLPVFCANLR